MPTASYDTQFRPLDAAVQAHLDRQAVVALLDRDAIDRVALDPVGALRHAYIASELRDALGGEATP